MAGGRVDPGPAEPDLGASAARVDSLVSLLRRAQPPAPVVPRMSPDDYRRGQFLRSVPLHLPALVAALRGGA